MGCFGEPKTFDQRLDEIRAELEQLNIEHDLRFEGMPHVDRLEVRDAQSV